MNITSGVILKAQKIVLYGPEGIGKSTFAAQFPDPLFIDTEGSTNLMDVKRLDKPSSWSMLASQVIEVRNTPECCKTLIIDTIDWAEHLCNAHICANAGKTGIEDFGYGKGYVYVKEEFGKLLNALTEVTEAGINVVLTAHSILRKFEKPDEAGAYDRYELKLGNKAGSQISALVKEWADMLLFANYKEMIIEINGKKKAQGGQRVMYTQHHPCWDAKNRHNLPEEMPFDYMQIAHCFINEQKTGESEPQKKDAPNTAKEPEKELPKQVPINPKKEAPAKHSKAQEPKKQTKEADAEDLSKVNKKLAGLMQASNITKDEISQFAQKAGCLSGYVEVENFPIEFIEQVVIPKWDRAVNFIENNIRIPF